MKMKDLKVLSVNDVRKILRENKKNRQRLPEAASRFLSIKKWEFQSKHRLGMAIPKGGKYRVLRKIACLFDREISVDNFKLAQCLRYKLIGNKKLNESDYEHKRTKYNERIRNHFKVLNKLLKSTGRAVRFGKYRSRVILLKTDGWRRQK